ncbi:putative oxidoreductase [Nocardioides zeae]|uniref:Oxidoreductase n=1 Tax=Nocardioides zeae TaxID=1457234 RepID=A0ACC6IDG7_9ACTN|nr:DoxX family protein [Nocardioides zeae]MDR6175796.1 putative oxidoreductase [Nocardioides zeae]MDR6208724.1 putative oxidoreductase [Nocardioides zeae]
MFRSLVTPAPAVVQDVVLLLVRLVTGVVLIAHGWQKVSTNGLDATGQGFDALGVPVPDAAATFTAGVELVGGALLLVGLLTPVAGVLVALVLAGAFWFAHRGTTVFVGEGGWELVAALGALGLVLAAVGPGRLSVDAALAGARRGARAEAPVREDAGVR